MTPDRFSYLLDAYGADFARWPQAERDAARLARDTDHAIKALWDEAQAFDDLIALPRVAPDADLRERVIAMAATAGLRPRAPVNRWFSLWSGAGIAATGVAGALLGVVLANHLNAPMRAETVLYQASLQATDDVDVLGMDVASLEDMH